MKTTPGAAQSLVNYKQEVTILIGAKPPTSLLTNDVINYILIRLEVTS